MKIVTKIFLGFLVVISICGIASTIGYWSMKYVQKGNSRLAYEFIPEVKCATAIESNLLETIDVFNNYSLSFEQKYYEEGIKDLGNLKEAIANAKKIGDQYESLSILRDGIKQIEPLLQKFEINISQTNKAVEEIASIQKRMDVSASAFITNCSNFLSIQNQSLEKEFEKPVKEELNERHLKITLINQIIDIGNSIRVDNFKSQARRDQKIIQNALKSFDQIDMKASEIRKYVKLDENKIQLDNISSSAKEYQGLMKDFLEKVQMIESMSKLRMEISTEIIRTSKGISEAGMERTVKFADDSVNSLSKSSSVMLVCFTASIVIGLLIAFFITASIKGPIRKVVEFTNQFGKGDLRVELMIQSTDELGEMSKDLNESVRNIKTVIKELADTTHSLSGSSEELASISSQMAASTEEMNSQANMIAASSEEVNASVSMVASATEELSSAVSDIASMTEEMSATFQNVAKSSRKTADNVKIMAQSAENISSQINSVASSVEEMTVSLNEVAKNTSQANRISQNATQKAQQINTRMNALVSASKQIGKIVSVIKDIADQTNMLALNATIEAAGAGDAGKGFAVVAGEVKELARQSADATDEISGQIDEIRKSTDDAVQAIEEIKTVISDIAGINEMIAASAEEQTATAGEISKSIVNVAMTIKSVAENANESSLLVTDIAKSTEETSKTAVQIAKNIDELVNGVKEVARSSSEGAKGVNEISKNIAAIGQASKQTAVGAAQTNESSRELAKMATILTQLMAKFKL